MIFRQTNHTAPNLPPSLHSHDCEAIFLVLEEQNDGLDAERRLEKHSTRDKRDGYR